MAWYPQLNAAITKEARARNIPMPDLNNLPPSGAVNFCFPHFFLLPTFGNMLSYRSRPLGPEKCLYEIWSLSLHPEDEQSPRPIAPHPMAADDPRWPGIPAQDFANLPLQQEGLHAEGFEYMRLARDVEGVISNNHRVIDGFLAGVPTEKLIKGMQIACSSASP